MSGVGCMQWVDAGDLVVAQDNVKVVLPSLS